MTYLWTRSCWRRSSAWFVDGQLGGIEEVAQAALYWLRGFLRLQENGRDLQSKIVL